MGANASLPKPSDLPAEDRGSVLPAGVSVKGFAQAILAGKIRKVIVVAGAGLSVSAGIPDFRTPKTGLYDNLEKYGLTRPEEIFDIGFFQEEELYPGKFRPTLAHYFLKLLEDKGILLRVYTQNIDTLERLTGLSAEKVIECHGSFASATCRTCGSQYPQAWMAGKIFGEDGVIPFAAGDGTTEAVVDLGAVVIPRCDSAACGGIVKPDITFFGESLPERYASSVGPDTKDADALIVVGTSLKVAPVSSIPAKVGVYCPRLLINREVVNVCDASEDTTTSTAPAPEVAADPAASEMSAFLQQMAGDNTAFRFFLGDNYRDVLLQADSDDGAWTLACELGWDKELHALCPDIAEAALQRLASVKSADAAMSTAVKSPAAKVARSGGSPVNSKATVPSARTPQGVKKPVMALSSNSKSSSAQRTAPAHPTSHSPINSAGRSAKSSPTPLVSAAKKSSPSLIEACKSTPASAISSTAPSKTRSPSSAAVAVRTSTRSPLAAMSPAPRVKTSSPASAAVAVRTSTRSPLAAMSPAPRVKTSSPTSAAAAVRTSTCSPLAAMSPLPRVKTSSPSSAAAPSLVK